MIIKRAAHGRHLLKTGALPEAKPVLAARRRPPGRRRAPSLPFLYASPQPFLARRSASSFHRSPVWAWTFWKLRVRSLAIFWAKAW